MNELIKLTKLCMYHNIFQFNNELYKQTGGTSMSNPLSPLIAKTFRFF